MGRVGKRGKVIGVDIACRHDDERNCEKHFLVVRILYCVSFAHCISELTTRSEWRAVKECWFLGN